MVWLVHKDFRSTPGVVNVQPSLRTTELGDRGRQASHITVVNSVFHNTKQQFRRIVTVNKIRKSGHQIPSFSTMGTPVLVPPQLSELHNLRS